MLNTLMLAAAIGSSSPATDHGGGRDAAEANCRGLYDLHAASDANLDYRAFDQRPSGGWRAMERVCPDASVDLLRLYLARNATGLKPNQTANLRFRAAQLLLRQNRRDDAVPLLEGATVPFDTTGGRLDWNGYVRATIAFLRNDRPAFDRELSALSATGRCADVIDCRPDPNLRVVEDLARCWGRPYRIAYYDCPPTARDVHRRVAE